MTHQIYVDQELWKEIDLNRDLICIPKRYFTKESNGNQEELKLRIGDVLWVKKHGVKKDFLLKVQSHWQGDKYMVPLAMRMVGVRRVYEYSAAQMLSGVWFVKREDVTEIL